MDNDAETAALNLRHALGEEEAARWLSPGPNMNGRQKQKQRRWAIINLWRPVGDVVRQWPLGLVDARDVVKGRDTAPIYTLANYKSHFTALKPRDHFRFYYVSDLAPDEAILFVDFDSRCHQGRLHEEGGEQMMSETPVVGMAHGAFHDHNAPERCPRRRSIEVRSLVLYDD